MTYNFSEIAATVRRDIIRMCYEAQSAHLGGSLSCVEILVALYWRVMHIDPKRPDDPNRDRLFFSKAHDVKALYAVLGNRGFFPKEWFFGYEKDCGHLAGHAVRGIVPGVEISAGSLGHGLSMAAGAAFALKKRTMNDEQRTVNNYPRVFTIISDGECDEGSVWEAALFAAHHKLDNLIAVIDYNKLQAYGRIKDVLNLEPLTKKWEAFCWSAREVDGHDLKKLTTILLATPFVKGKPSVIIAHTIKGFGGPKRLIEQVSSQYKPPTEEEYRELIG